MFFLFWACGSDSDDPFNNSGTGGTGSGTGTGSGNGSGNGNTTWSIPIDQVFDGGPGKDGIPALESPNFTAPSEATYLFDDDLVIGYKVGDEIRAYPHKIMDWHEIVNDRGE